MTATKHRQTSHLEHTFAIPIEQILDLLPATARESLAGWEMSCYPDTADGGDGEDDVLLVTFSQRRIFEPDPSGKMVEKPRTPLDRCVRKGEVQAMIETTIEHAKTLAQKAQPPAAPDDGPNYEAH